MSFSTAARAFSGTPCVSSKRSSIGRPSTPPPSLIILAATSAPSLTWVPWDTEPGGDWAIVTPTLIGSAASAPVANRPVASASSVRCVMRMLFFTAYLPEWPLSRRRTLTERPSGVEIDQGIGTEMGENGWSWVSREVRSYRMRRHTRPRTRRSPTNAGILQAADAGLDDERDQRQYGRRWLQSSVVLLW